jgi:type I restriction enzyme S subunit
VSSSLPLIPLGEVLTPISRPEPIDPERTYRILGAHWYAKGLYVKDILGGAQIQAARVYRVEEGDFVYNRLFAWKGSFALGTQDTDGCYVSNEFPCFRIQADRIHEKFLRWYFSREPAWTEALGLSKGGTPTSRNRLKEEAFLAMTIPLPPRPAQEQLVERIDALAAKIEEAKRLYELTGKGASRLLIAMAHRDDLDQAEKLKQGWRPVTLGEVLKVVSEPRPVKTDETYPNLGIYSFGRGLFKKPAIEGSSTSARTLYRVKAGQFIYSRLFAFEGAYGVVTKDYEGHFVSNEYPTFECDPSYISAAFLDAYFRNPRIWAEIATGSKGLGDRRQRVHPERVLGHRLFLPPLEWQLQMFKVRSELTKLDQFRSELQNEINALLPAILDRAFKGEL